MTPINGRDELLRLVQVTESNVQGSDKNGKINTKDEYVFFQRQATMFGHSAEDVEAFLKEEGVNITEIMGFESSETKTQPEKTIKTAELSKKDRKFVEDRVYTRVKQLLKKEIPANSLWVFWQKNLLMKMFMLINTHKLF